MREEEKEGVLAMTDFDHDLCLALPHFHRGLHYDLLIALILVSPLHLLRFFGLPRFSKSPIGAKTYKSYELVSTIRLRREPALIRYFTNPLEVQY